MLKKASKRLISAIIALIASVLLCIGVCLAWFAVNNEVRGDGLKSQLRGDDIVSLKVTAYYLNAVYIGEGESKTFSQYAIATTYGGNKYGDGAAITDGGVAITVDTDGDGIIDGSDDKMRPFNYGNEYTTAVLFKIEYELLGDSDKTFRIFAECPDTSRLTVEENTVTGGKEFKSNLSNAVIFKNATPTGADGGYSAADSKYTFVTDAHEKSFNLDFKENIRVDKTALTGGNYVGTEYVIMDYDSDRFSYLSSLVLENGGNLNSGLELTGDITLGIEEYDPEKVVEPESIELEVNAPPVVTEVAAGSDPSTMTQTWQFAVTYSNGRMRVFKVSGDHSNLVIGNVDVSSLGEKTVTVTYTENGKTISTDVNYTVTIAISGGTGVAVGNTLELTALGAGDKTVTWNTSDANVATVADGVVTGVAEGTATITATVTDGGKEYTATCVVTVGGASTVTSVAASASKTTATVGDEITLSATVAGTNTPSQAVTWEITEGNSYATLSGNKLTATAAGTVKVQATSVADTSVKSNVVTITVEEAGTTVAVTGVTINQSTLTLTAGGTATLTATVAPENATNKAVTWSSDNTAVATVSSSGKVTAVAAGTANIIVTTADGEFTASCTVTVQAADLPTDYTTGTHTLTFNGDADIFTSTAASSDGGYGTSTDSVTRFKLGTNDYLYVTVKLQAGKLIKVSGTARPSNSASSVKLNISATADSTGAVSGIEVDQTFSGTGADFNYTYTVTTEGIIVLQFKRSTTSTGCEITSLTIEIADSAEQPTITGVTANASKTTATVGDEITLSATVTGTGDYSNEVTWTIAKGNATLSGNVLTATAAGTVTIVATSTADTTKSGEITITFNAAAGTVAIFVYGGELPNNVTVTSGNYASSSTSFDYDGTTYTAPLKIESSTQITIVLSSKQKLTIVTSASGSIKINGTSYNVANSITLEAGTYTLTKDTSFNLHYITFEPAE